MKYTDSQILEAVKACTSWAAVYRLLSGKTTGNSPGMQSHLKRRALKAGADTSHFRWQRSVPHTVVTPPQ